MSPGKPTTPICGACTTTRLSGYNPGTICGSVPASAAGAAGRRWPGRPGRPGRLDFPAVPVLHRSAARLSRRELGERTGLSHSMIWYCEAGARRGIYDIRQRLQFADSVEMPRSALLPVILGEPRPPGDLLAESVATPMKEPST
jgi:hypothetical protein